MTVTSTYRVEQIPRLTRSGDARAIADAAYDQLLSFLTTVDVDAWSVVTPDCPDWTMADMVGHLIGAAKSHISFREFVRQMRHGRRQAGTFDGNEMDAINDLQVRDHRDLTPAERVALLAELAPRAVAGRMRVPGLVRRRRIPMPSGGSVAPGTPETLLVGNLLDAILTRDVWMHRLDIARALGVTLDLDTDVDRRIVADVVAEWAAVHGRSFTLHLDGPAGGSFTHGTGGGTLRVDAVGFCRALSGRAPAEGLLATRVLF